MGTESQKCVDILVEIASSVNKLTLEYHRLAPDERKNIRTQAAHILMSTEKFVQNNMDLIPLHSLKTINDGMKKLEIIVKKPEKEELKFTFKSKPPADAGQSASKSTDVVVLEQSDIPTSQTVPDVTSPPVDISLSQFKLYEFKDRQNEELTLRDIDGRDINLTKLTSCKVNIIGLANTVHLSGLNQCSVILYLASRAITITNCNDCNFKLVCQQLRITSSRSNKFSVHISARSMLEDSIGLSFSPLDLKTLDGLVNETERDNLLVAANFQAQHNNWRSIDDFDWLNPREPSTNYSLLEDM